MIIHVRNFGKIKKADIDLSDFVIFVGENNSGKTYLMQLIYGVFDFFCSKKFRNFLLSYNGLKSENDPMKVSLPMKISLNDRSFMEPFTKALNRLLEKEKNTIVASVFHTDSIAIEHLSVDFTGDYSSFFSINNEEHKFGEGNLEETDGRSFNRYTKYTIMKNGSIISQLGFETGIDQSSVEIILKGELLAAVVAEITGVPLEIHPMKINTKPFLYLPASRSGIMLLYANYLSNDNTKNLREYVIKEDKDIETENEYGLTDPVYDFLMFLLQHKFSEMTTKQNEGLISFIDQNIIGGHMEKVGNSMLYKPDKSEQMLPIRLSSSLVSELAPLYQVLTGVRRLNFIMYDEIETCQHPTKQLQLARLLIRMVNNGFKMIVSTHSDTMATAINNLITLSYKTSRTELLSKLGYEEDDILQNAKVKAYQFVMENDKTKVVEVPSHFSVGVGFNFDLFNFANNKIYEDAVSLAEVD